MCLTDLSNLLSNIIDPNSRVNGFATLLASTGTIWALWLNIQSVKASNKQNDLLLKKGTLKSLEDSLENILERIVFKRPQAGGDEVYFGKSAIYRASHNQSTVIFDGGKNVNHFKDYIKQFGETSEKSLKIIYEPKKESS